MAFNTFKFAYSQSRHIIKRAFSINTLSTPKEIKIEIPNGQIAAKLWNESGKKTPILALHGWMDNAGSWDNICPLIDKDYPVYALDLPGHGYSYNPKLTGGTYFMDYVVTLHRILHQLRWKKVILLGHSMGGDISLVYTGIMPAVVEKLITLDTILPFYVNAENQPDRTASSLTGLLKAEEKLDSQAPRYEYEKIVQKLVEGYMDSVNEEAAKTLLVRNSRKHEDGKYSFTFSPYLKVNVTLSATLEQLRAYLAGITCDLLVVRATSSVRYIPTEVAREFIESFSKTSKNFVFEVVDGTHHVHMINPNPVAQFINNFLSGVPQSQENKKRSNDFIKSDDL